MRNKHNSNNRLQFMSELMNVCESDNRYSEHINMVVALCIAKKMDATSYLDELFEFWCTGKKIQDKLKYDMSVMGFNPCNNPCSHYVCINNFQNKGICIRNNKRCKVAIQNGIAKCGYGFGNNPCRIYYKCYLDYLSGKFSYYQPESGTAARES